MRACDRHSIARREEVDDMNINEAREELKRLKYRLQLALSGKDPMPADEYRIMSERHNALDRAVMLADRADSTAADALAAL